MLYIGFTVNLQKTTKYSYDSNYASMYFQTEQRNSADHVQMAFLEAS